MAEGIRLRRQKPVQKDEPTGRVIQVHSLPKLRLKSKFSVADLDPEILVVETPQSSTRSSFDSGSAPLGPDIYRAKPMNLTARAREIERQAPSASFRSTSSRFCAPISSSMAPCYTTLSSDLNERTRKGISMAKANQTETKFFPDPRIIGMPEPDRSPSPTHYSQPPAEIPKSPTTPRAPFLNTALRFPKAPSVFDVDVSPRPPQTNRKLYSDIGRMTGRSRDLIFPDKSIRMHDRPLLGSPNPQNYFQQDGSMVDVITRKSIWKNILTSIAKKKRAESRSVNKVKALAPADRIAIFEFNPFCVTKEGHQRITGQLAEIDQLTLLDFSRCSLLDDGTLAMKSIISENETITNINLSTNNLGLSGIRNILDTVGTRMNTAQITRLSLGGQVSDTFSGDSVVDELVALASSTFEKPWALTHLHLDCGRISDDGLTFFSKHLNSEFPSLVNLDLSRNSFGAKGVTDFAVALEHNSSLETLNMSFNEIGNVAGNLIAKRLAKNDTIRMINMQATNLGDSAIAEFIMLSVDHEQLKTLELSDNQGATATAHALIEAIRHPHTQLTEVRMRNSSMPPEAVIACALAMDSNTTMLVLELHSSRVVFEQKALIAINMALQRNHLLKKSIGSSLLQNTLRLIIDELGEEARQSITRKQQMSDGSSRVP